MMQRKNKPKSTSTSGYGSGYESNDNNDNNYGTSPSKPSTAPQSSGGISIAALTGHKPSHKSTSKVGLERKKSKDGNGISGGGGSGSHKGGSRVKGSKSKIAIATVKRATCGTQPFDRHWLNLDCCGLICATLTYMLHLYGVYTFGWILLPPWFSVMDEDGYRELTIGCHLHRTLFILIAALAVFSHFKAMTTDPGAVPPDANPLPEFEELDELIKGESPTKNSNAHVGGLGNSNGLGGNNGHLGSSSGIEVMERGTNGGGLDSSLNRGSSQGGNNKSNSSNTSSLMQEDNGSLLDNNGLPQALTTAGAVGAAVVGAAGAAAMVGGAAVASGVGAVASAAGPMKPRDSPMPRPQSSSHQHQQQPRGRRMCRRCQAFKPPRAHHCSICKRCIIKMDHHCPWVNNCVGIGNHKYFLLFIFYTSLSCAYSFLFIIYRVFHCIGSSHRHGPRCVDHPTDLLPLVGLTVEALLFGLFTICMMVDQWDVVMTNLTHIDRLKGETHHLKTHPGYGNHHQHAGSYGQLPQHYQQHVGSSTINKMRAGINEVFGTVRHVSTSLSTTTAPNSRFHYTWLSPFHKLCFPDSVRDDIFGYCRPCGPPTGAGGVLAEGARRITKSMEMVGRGGEKKKGRGGVAAAEIV